MRFNQTVRNIQRVRRVVEVILKYGFEDIVVSTPLKKVIPSRQMLDWTHGDRSVLEFSRFERIRMIVEELGPTFIKLAQVLSNRPDVLPAGLIVEFEKLQSHVPPFDAAKARAIFEQETGQPISELFAWFDEIPLGSASIGQVHRGRLRTGEDVVVKIQRPGVQEKVRTDLILLREFVRLTENYFLNNGILNPLEIVETFDKTVQRELDYRTEARHMEQFRRIYRDRPHLLIPKPYRKLTTERVLVADFVSGCKITDIEQLRAWGLDPRTMARRGTDIYLNQIFEEGFFHADPHPGNVLVKPDGTIALIDFGMVGKLLKPQKFAFSGVFIGMARRDAKGMAASLRRLAVETDIVDMRAFEYDLGELIEDYAVLDVGEMQMADFVSRLQKIIYRYRLHMPGPVFLILRALTILEGIGRTLDPTFDTVAAVRPFGARMVARQYAPDQLARETEYTLSQLASLLYTFPSDLKFIFRRIRQGTFNLQVEIGGTADLLRKLDFVINKLALALIIASLLVASSITLTVPAPASSSDLLGLPYVSIIGFSLAGVLGLILIFYALRKR